MMRWLCALAVGVTLTISEHNGPWWITVALLSLATIVFGVWASNATRETTIFWHASGPMFVAVAIVGIMTVVLLYRARPEAQPSVLPPWPVFVVAVVMIAATWAAIAGALALALGQYRRQG